MKIYNSKIGKALSIYNKQGINKNEIIKDSSRFKKDSVQLSNKAKDYQVAMKALKDIPDIRKDKVDVIRREIRSGNYSVDSSKIVEKIFEGIIIDKKA